MRATGFRYNYLYGVDLIRFGSALLVAFFHLGYSCWASPTSGGVKFNAGSYSLPNIAYLIWFGWIGVQIFFVVSGVVIANSANGSTPIKFLKGRLLRLYPAVWFCATMTLLCLILLDLTGGAEIRYLASMLLIPTGPWIDGQYWTLGVEIIFYGIVFISLSLGCFGKIQIIAIFLAVVSFFYNIVVSFNPVWGYLMEGDYRLLLIGHGAFFAVGLLIWLWSVGRLNLGGRFAAVLAVAGGLMQIRTEAISMGLRLTNSPFQTGDRWSIAALIWLLACLGIILAFRYQTVFAHFSDCALKWIVRAGRATYPLYLLHFSIGITTVRLLVERGVPPTTALLVTITLMTGAAVLVSDLLEPVVQGRLRVLIEKLEERLLARYTWLSFLDQAEERAFVPL